MHKLILVVIATTLSGCFVIGGIVGATSENVHNNSPNVRSGKDAPVHRAGIGLAIGLAADLALVALVVIVGSGNKGQ